MARVQGSGAMTLVLELCWSAPSTTVRVRDTAAHNVVAEASAAHPDPDADHRQAPDAWWSAATAATTGATDAASAMGIAPEEISMVLVADGDPAGGLVPLDSHGAVLADAILGSHEASGADAEWLVGHTPGGAEAWHDATGALPQAGSTVALLSWLHRTDPDAWAELDRLTLPTGWLVAQLTGDHHLGTHCAAATGVLDRHSGRSWRTELLSVVDADRDWRAALPTLVVPADAAGGLTTAAAASLGLRHVLPVHVGGALPAP